VGSDRRTRTPIETGLRFLFRAPPVEELMPDAFRDYDAVARQLSREPRPFRVAARCPFGLPSVIENERTREMPTSFWVTCPSLVAAISRVESTGGVREAREAVGEPVVEEIHDEHRSRYGTRVAGVRDGATGSVKCLHAFTALHVSGAIPNPVAEWTLGRLGDPYPEGRCCIAEGTES
jgi:uncharacterized protein